MYTVIQATACCAATQHRHSSSSGSINLLYPIALWLPYFCCTCAPAVTRVVSSGHVNIQVNVLTKVCATISAVLPSGRLTELTSKRCSTDTDMCIMHHTHGFNLKLALSLVLDFSGFAAVHCATLCCVQDMAAFGYSDGSNKDQSSSMPVQL